MSWIMNVALVSLLGFILASVDAYEMRVNNNRMWYNNPRANEIGSSYQFFYPGRSHNNNYNNRQKINWNQHNRMRNKVRWNDPNSIREKYHWKYNRDFSKKMPIPAMPTRPPPQQRPRMATREWPSYIPPIRMIKLPLDEPPAPI